MRKNLYRHQRSHEEIITIDEDDTIRDDTIGDFECYVCDKKFASTSILNRHKRKVHNLALEGDLKCPLCESSYKSRIDLDVHLLKEHEIKQEVISLTFQSFEGTVFFSVQRG
jgi:uncharacterized C2H2 Zn-finger protein